MWRNLKNQNRVYKESVNRSNNIDTSRTYRES
jgi:hypothetical protein